MVYAMYIPTGIPSRNSMSKMAPVQKIYIESKFQPTWQQYRSPLVTLHGVIQSTPPGVQSKGPAAFTGFTPSASCVQQADPTCTTSVITRSTGRENLHWSRQFMHSCQFMESDCEFMN